MRVVPLFETLLTSTMQALGDRNAGWRLLGIAHACMARRKVISVLRS